MTFKEIKRHEKFKKDLKSLLKKFPTLNEDLNTAIQTQMVLFHKHKIDNHGVERINELRFENPPIFKMRKFACKCIPKGVQSGMRLIYAFFQLEDRIELIEIYFKGEKINEDRERIKEFYGEGK